jgi:hypothetical protein
MPLGCYAMPLGCYAMPLGCYAMPLGCYAMTLCCALLFPIHMIHSLHRCNEADFDMIVGKYAYLLFYKRRFKESDVAKLERKMNDREAGGKDDKGGKKKKKKKKKK